MQRCYNLGNKVYGIDICRPSVVFSTPSANHENGTLPSTAYVLFSALFWIGAGFSGMCTGTSGAHSPGSAMQISGFVALEF